MAREAADDSILLADMGLHRDDVTRSARAHARKLFAEIAVRIVAFACDVVLILFLMVVVDDHVLAPHGLSETVGTPLWVAVLIAYFALSWAGPLRATPFQWLLGMHVLERTGRPLSFREAAIRSVALVASWGLALFLLREFYVPGMGFRVAVVALMLYVPSVTVLRQGLHDLVARSIVVNRRALGSADDRQRMLDFLAGTGPVSSKDARPTVVKMATDAVVLAIPLALMSIGVQVSHQKNLYGRVAYAMGETYELQQQLRARYLETGAWPRDEAALGMPMRREYPAGGYLQLEGDGVIRIQFEITPELRHGSLLLEPRVADDSVSWHCRAVGDIDRAYVPGSCRD